MLRLPAASRYLALERQTPCLSSPHSPSLSASTAARVCTCIHSRSQSEYFPQHALRKAFKGGIKTENQVIENGCFDSTGKSKHFEQNWCGTNAECDATWFNHENCCINDECASPPSIFSAHVHACTRARALTLHGISVGVAVCLPDHEFCFYYTDATWNDSTCCGDTRNAMEMQDCALDEATYSQRMAKVQGPSRKIMGGHGDVSHSTGTFSCGEMFNNEGCIACCLAGKASVQTCVDDATAALN